MLKNRQSCRQYKPFLRKTDFLICSDDKNRVTQIINSRYNYSLAIKPGGFTPKTGILLCQYLDRLPIKNKNILDVGTGQTALIAIHSAAMGAHQVIGLDIDKQAIAWAKKNRDANNLTRKINLKTKSISDYKDKKQVDIVVSNPPQMPVERQISLHDDGGWDGRGCMKSLISMGEQVLKSNGLLIFNVFDFLGVNQSFNENSSIFEILRNHSFKPKIVKRATKIIKPGSYTFKNIHHIQKVYPQYKFRTNKKGHLQYTVLVISARKCLKK
ncbi:MAG: class I SAM-dependent methyltransferase [Patescibacteria group bacterium]